MTQVPREIQAHSATFSTQTDLSSYKYYLGKLSSGLIVLNDTKGGPVAGVIIEKVKGSATDEKPIGLQISGIARIKAGGNISENDQVVPDASGQVISDDAANQFVVGIALEAGVSGDLVSVRLTLNPTTTA
jgi:hypothetical protein